MDTRRPAKRAQRTESRSRIGPVTSLTFFSGSSEDSSESRANISVDDPVVDISEALLSLGTSENQDQAIEAIGKLQDWSASDAQELLGLQGLSVIVCSLLRYKSSEAFVSEALSALSNMTCKPTKGEVGRLLVGLNFFESIVSLATQHHADSRCIQESASIIFRNLAIDASPQMKTKLGTVEISQFMTSLTNIGLDTDAIERACIYFSELKESPTVMAVAEKGYFLETVLRVATQRLEDSKDIINPPMELFLDLIEMSLEWKTRLGTVKMAQFMMNSINAYPGDTKIVQDGYFYFAEMTQIPEVTNWLTQSDDGLNFLHNIPSLITLHHADSKEIQEQAVGIFRNLVRGDLIRVANPKLKAKLGSDKIFQFMMSSMDASPNDMLIVESVCVYFGAMSNVLDVKAWLTQKEDGLNFLYRLPLLANQENYDSSRIQESASVIFRNLVSGASPQVKAKLGTVEIVQFMMNLTNTFPYDTDTVQRACIYFLKIKDDPKVMAQLVEQGWFIDNVSTVATQRLTDSKHIINRAVVLCLEMMDTSTEWKARIDTVKMAQLLVNSVNTNPGDMRMVINACYYIAQVAKVLEVSNWLTQNGDGLNFLYSLPPLVKLHHTDSRDVHEKVVVLFRNLVIFGANPQLKVKLGTDEIMHLMMSSMSAFTDNIQIFESVCVYFGIVSKGPELKVRLTKNEDGLKFLYGLPPLATQHSDSKDFQNLLVVIFSNLMFGANAQLKIALGTNEIMEFMMNSMAAYPDDMGIVEHVCVYFWSISKVPEMKVRLLKLGVVQPLAAAFHKFCNRNGEGIENEVECQVQNIVKWSKLASTEIMS